VKVIVEVMLKPEILDPQGGAVLAALPRLGMTGVRSVRQGKRFELDLDGEPDMDQINRIADGLLSNPVIEDYTVHVSRS
jgi:phosphoribosylformylglycinamidine synthase subunit PurS